jgi:Bacterial regulatory proteins, luxR family
MARVLSRSGRWVVLHGAALLSGADRRVAVIVEPAHPARITSLLMAAYELTERERDVTRLVLQGAATGDIARELSVSPHTVQQHLKSVFDKPGYAAAVTWSARCSCRTTSPGFETTSTESSSKSRSAVALRATVAVHKTGSARFGRSAASEQNRHYSACDRARCDDRGPYREAVTSPPLSRPEDRSGCCPVGGYRRQTPVSAESW